MILCCGEALIDMLPRQSAAGASCFQPFSGGAVFNTAIALARLGAPSGLFTGISNDLFGAQLVKSLEDSGVATGYAPRSDRPTTLAFVELVNGQARYAFYDENTAGRMLAVADIPQIPDEIRTLFFGGISLVVEPCASTYEHLMLSTGPDRVKMIDPNIRPGFIKDEAAYRARLERMIAAADIVKLSDEDLHWLEGAGDITELARRIIGRGPKVVFITEGAKGARAVTATQDRCVAATPVTVADTVGAGDTFNAGVLAALHAAGVLTKAGVAALPDAVLDQALSLGTRAAAVTVSRPGANPPWTHEL